MNKLEICSIFHYKLIYVFRINDNIHTGCLKIGEATLTDDGNKKYTSFFPNCHELNCDAKKRIDEYTTTAGIKYELLYTEIAVYEKDGKLKAFRDYKVHEVLKRSGIKQKYFDTHKKQNEWFITDLNTVKLAIKAVKEEKTALNDSEITLNQSPIIFRPEQEDAIKKTITRFKNDTKMLWNAKMRFGKTLTSLQVVKKMNFKKTIIITHKPAVIDGWCDDFKKIFYDRKDYSFGSKIKGKTISDLLKNNNNFVYFISMQDLRGSNTVGGDYDKNNEIFKVDWDFVIVDEAHEGTKTPLGENVLKEIIKEESSHKTYVLKLSGTPFNLLTDFKKENIYTWDYIMEQEAKKYWDKIGDSNPYEELPKMNIYTYHLEKKLPVYIDVFDKVFNFKEFFKVWTGDIKKDGKPIPKECNNGEFIHEQDIKAFLDLICKEDENVNYPFAKNEYRNYFKHSLWVVPGVKEAKALSSLLKNHHIFKNFKIVNVAGDGDDEEINTSKALEAVKNAIGDNPDETYTITLSCGRLTTGVTVPEWTAVLMLAGSYSTSSVQYLQTIFRVQNPAYINGKIKKECYVFDFAPDRTLKEFVKLANLSAEWHGISAENVLKNILNFCPVIAVEGSNMKELKSFELFQELKKIYIEKVVEKGFDDPKIYNDKLLKLTKIDLEKFEDLKKIVGVSKQTKKFGEININNEGFTEEEIEEEAKLKKSKKELTEEEKERLNALKEKRKNKYIAISILRAISIRIPLLVYGMDIDINTDVTIDNFVDLMKDNGPDPDASWNEFMPKGVTKEIFKKFIEYYDKDIFIAASRRIRLFSKNADKLEPTERVKKIIDLFTTFKNPDKETVLTLWRVINLHLLNTIGGYCFYDDNFTNIIKEPRFINLDSITSEIFSKKAQILELNSKTGLYPLFMTYSIYKSEVENKNLTLDEKYSIWDNIVKNQIFVVCKTQMAKMITKRTLLGYRNNKINIHAFNNLIMQLKEKRNDFINRILKKSFWKKEGEEQMKFNVIVGNPPYQKMDAKENSERPNNPSSSPIYPYFVDICKKLNPDYFSLIMPSRWLTKGAGKGLDNFHDEMSKEKHIKIFHNYSNAKDLFSNVDIMGGICYFLWQKDYNDKAEYYYHENNKITPEKVFLSEIAVCRDQEIRPIYNKIKKKMEEKKLCPFEEKVSEQKPYGFRSDFFKNPSKYKFPPISKEEIPDGYCIYGLLDAKRTKRYLSKDYPIPKKNGLGQYKVFISKAFGNSLNIPNPIIGKKNDLCTETFLQILVEDENEANNIIAYFKTKFFRLLLSIKKNTQIAAKKVYSEIPFMNFKESWNDEKLFKYFELTNDEIEIINKKIKD